MALITASGCGRLGFGLFDDPADADVQDGRNTSDAIDLDRGLIAWLQLDETSGSVAFDSSGANNHGFIYQAQVGLYTWKPGRVGNALHFDNTSSEMGIGTFGVFPTPDITCAAPLPFPSSVTVSSWVLLDRFQDWNNFTLSDVAVMHGSNGGAEGGWGIGATNACGTFTAAVTVTSSDAVSRATRCGTRVLPQNTWVHIAGVYDAGARTLDVYVDGVKESGAMAPNSAAIPAALHSPPSCVHLASGSNQYNLMSGALDQVRVYQRPLNDAEIAALYDKGG